MKKVLIAALSVAALSGCVELTPAPPQDLTVQHVHEINLKKDQIYDKSLEWMAKTFVDSKAVIEIKDKESGKILGKGLTNFISAGIASIPCRFTMMIEIKDGRYRTTFDDFVGMWGEFQNSPQPLKAKDHVDQVRAKLEDMDRGLSQFLSATPKDW